jgi:hypothetical protein
MAACNLTMLCCPWTVHDAQWMAAVAAVTALLMNSALVSGSAGKAAVLLGMNLFTKDCSSSVAAA